MQNPIPIAWFHEADYNGLREMFEDGKRLPLSFQQWLEVSEGLLEFLKEQGVLIEKVYVTPENFPIWCRERGLNLNSRSRIEFVKFVLASRNKNASKNPH